MPNNIESRVIKRFYDGDKLVLGLDCGCEIEWESDSMLIPPVYRHDCGDDGSVGWSPDMYVPNS